MTLNSISNTLRPLPPVLQKGLVAVSTFGLLSFFCSTSLFLYLTYKIITWRLSHQRSHQASSLSRSPPLNQFIFLIYNLLLADIQQALAFLLNISALRNNAIVVGTSTCFAQGWFVSTGDLASSVFICAIAVHTFLGVVKDYRLPTATFYGGIAGLWVFIYGLAILGPLMHPGDFYVRASAWCWINDTYQSSRLWLHYFWIFVFMFSTILIYALIFLTLRSRSLAQPSPHSPSPLMILYPLIYVVCTSPLAIGRIASLAGHPVSLEYFCAAGTMIACNGWLDVLLYASTRAELVFSEYAPGEETGLETFAWMGKGHKMGTTTTIEGGERVGMGRRERRGDSVENLYGLGAIGVKVDVVQASSKGMVGDGRGRGGSVAGSEGWDGRSVRSVRSGKSCR